MKVAYFTDTFLPQVNGIATSLANQAKKLGEQGHEILIFTAKSDHIKRPKFQAENVHLIHLPSVPALLYPEYRLGVLGLPKVMQYLLKFNPDIIHLHSPFTIGLDGVMAAKLLKKPLVGSIHLYLSNPDYLKWIKYNLAVKLLKTAALRYLYFIYGQCDMVLSPSRLFAKELGENGFKKKVLPLPNGVYLNQFRQVSEKHLNNLKEKLKLKKKVVLHFGRLSYEKNVDLVIKTFSELVKRHPDVSLLIIGDGPATASLKKLVKKLAIEKDVIFTGFIAHQTLMSDGFLQLGEVFLTTSTMENQPMAILEAMSFGLPIVGVKQAGLIELVAGNGVLVEAGNIHGLGKATEEVLYNLKLASKMRERSLKIAQNYSIEKTTAKLVKLYEKLVNQSIP